MTQANNTDMTGVPLEEISSELRVITPKFREIGFESGLKSYFVKGNFSNKKSTLIYEEILYEEG